MKKYFKILSSSFVLLLMLSNISFAFTYSICEMTMKSSCHCEMLKDRAGNNNNHDAEIHSKSCCSTEVKLINNSSDYESINKVVINIISLFPVSTNVISYHGTVFVNNIRKEQLIFYPEPADLSVKYSSLII